MPSSPVDRIPDGWIVFSSETPSNRELEAALQSKNFWQVSLSREKLELVPWSHKDRVTWRYKGGTLEGYDRGEFRSAISAGLTWSSPDGGEPVDLPVHDNVLGFLDTSMGTLVFTGLHHMISQDGHIYLLENRGASAPALRQLVKMKEEPKAFTNDASQMPLIATSSGLYRLNPTGGLEKIFSVTPSIQPNSILFFSSGVIYIGMRRFVLRLSPDGKEFKEEWLLPKKPGT